MVEEKELREECGEVHNVGSIEVMRGKVAESRKTGECAWCGLEVAGTELAYHMASHVEIELCLAKVQALRAMMITMREG